MPEYIVRSLNNEIQKLIQVKDGKTCVRYITSKGGDGKTILLRQIGMGLSSEDGIKAAFPWSGIIDLYHADVNSNSAIEELIVNAFGRGNEFQDYLDERDSFLERRIGGQWGEDLEDQRANLTRKFTECLNRVSEKTRLVIAFDTVERLQYDRDRAQEFIKLEAESGMVRDWLLNQLPQWYNCLVLLAGRPDNMEMLKTALQRNLSGRPNLDYDWKELGGFNDDECAQYFVYKEREYEAVRSMSPNFRKRLATVTQGNPVRLDLAIEIAERGYHFDAFQKQIESLGIGELTQVIDDLLIKQVMNGVGEQDAKLRSILQYLAIARKGLDVVQLHALTGDGAAYERNLDAVKYFSFVKQRDPRGPLYLHDEMYRICDANLLKADEVQETSTKLVEWFGEQIADALKESKFERAHELEVNSILYRMRADPRLGYQWYSERADQAIVNVSVGLDMQMRSELLAFLNSPSPIDERILRDCPGLKEEITCDDAVRWVKRYMFRGLNEQAAQSGVMSLQLVPGLSDPQDAKYDLARGELKVYCAQALTYLNQDQNAIRMLKEAIDSLERGLKPEEITEEHADVFVVRRRNRVLGRGHNNLGYTYWKVHSHLGAALREFKATIPYFRTSDLREEMANTSDNMGRVYALLYRQSAAESLVDDGLGLRRELGREYRYALSLISRALVYVAFDRPDRADPVSAEALRICDRLGARRGSGLASIARALVLRKLLQLGKVEGKSEEEIEEIFLQALSLIKNAINTFERRVGEPVRIIEAYNELGCLYRDDAITGWTEEGEPVFSKSRHRDAVETLKKAIQIAQAQLSPVWVADSCEDLAEVYFQVNDYANAEVWLQKADAQIPDEYKLKPLIPLVSPRLDERIEEFWLLMGKIELLRGHIAYDRGAGGSDRKASRAVLAEAIRHYAFSAKYLDHYAPGSERLAVTLRRLYERFKHCNLEDLEYVHRNVLDEIEREYAIDPALLRSFFEQTLGLPLPADLPGEE